MFNVLVPVDGSEASNRAVEHVLKRIGLCKDAVEIHLLNVQRGVPGGSAVSSHVGHDALRQHHQEEAMKALAPAMQKLDAAGVRYVHHIAVGEPADIIVHFAKEKQCDEILMGTRGLGGAASLLLGSVATQVIHLANVPVLLVK
jgi:nucleotide-binding universal stress UspA family protein